MNEVQIFSSTEFGEIRTLSINGEPWFIARDLSDILGYAQTNHMKRLIDAEDYKTIDPQSSEFSGFLQNGRTLEPNKNIRILAITNESGLYAAIFGSSLPNAKKFKRWVTSEVLPTIRRTGSYQIPQTTDGQIKLLAQGFVEMNEKVEKLTDEVGTVKDSVTTVRAEVEHLKLDLPLLPVEADNVSSAVKKRVVEILGGKKSRAYHDKSICQMAFSDAYKELKRQFGVRSYKNIKRGQIDNAIDVAMGYEPPVFLKEKIAGMNGKQEV